MNQQGTIWRAALGSVAKIGELYDAREDKFSGISIFKSLPPESTIPATDSDSMVFKYIHSDKYSEKFEKLDVKAEPKLSVLCGLFSLEGSGSYFSDQKSSKRAVRCTLIYKIRTIAEQLRIYDEALKACVSSYALERDATHVVIEISWGANLMVTAECQNEENEDTLVVGGALKAELQKVSFAISGKTEFDYGKGSSSKAKEFSLNIIGDVLPDGEVPHTIEGVIELMKKLPTLVRKANGGKGKPMQYTLLPIDELKLLFKVEAQIDTFVRTLSGETILEFVHLFENISDARQQLNDLCTDVDKYQLCVLDETKQMLEDLKAKVEKSDAAIRSKLSDLLRNVRSGKADLSELDDLRLKYLDEPYSARNTLMKLKSDQFAEISEKISLYKLLANKFGVTFVPKSKRRLVEVLVEYYGKDVYVLFAHTKAMAADEQLWSQQLNFFLSLIEKRKQQSGTTQTELSEFLYVDQDLARQLSVQGGQVIVVRHFKNGLCLSKDLFKDEATPTKQLGRNQIIRPRKKNQFYRITHNYMCGKCNAL